MQEVKNEAVTLIILRNPFNLKEYDKEFVEWLPEKTLDHYIPKVTGEHGPIEFVASVNGKVVDIKNWQETYLLADDNIIMCPIIGKGKKSIFKLIAMIAISVVSGGLGTALAGTSLFAGTATIFGVATSTVLGSIISFVGNSLVNSLMPNTASKSSKNRGGSDLSSSPSYGYDGPKNISADGVPVPVVYGTYRIGGNLISAYVENVGNSQFIYMLFAASEGEISGINNLIINDQPVASFKDVATEVRTGTATQSVMPWFGDILTPKTIGLKITNVFSTYNTVTVVDKLRFDVIFQSGLFAVDAQSGNTLSRSVELQIQYRKVGDATWIALGDSSVVDHYERRYVIDGVTYITLPTGYVDGKTLLGVSIFDNFGPGGFSSGGMGGYGVYNPTYNNGGIGGYGQTILNRDTVYVRKAGYFSLNSRDTYTPAGTAYQMPFYKTVVSITATQRTPLRRSFITPILPQGLYETRYLRTIAESLDPTVSDAVYMNEINEIVVDDVQYNNTALLGMRILMSDQLNGLPKITYIVEGVKVRVWDAETKAFVLQTSNNPAWAALDMLTKQRYGAGIPDSRIDLEKWKEWAAHCNQFHLTFNGVFDTTLTMWDAIAYVFRAGHAQIVSVGTRYSVVIERAESAVMMFSVANILENTFQINWLPMADRANEIDVTYFDAADLYKQRTIKVVDQDALANGLPIKNAAITMFGVIEPRRAYNEGLVALAMNKYILQTVTFEASIDAIACTVGDVIYVQHDMPQWGYAGRVEANNTTSVINLDRPMPIVAGRQYKLLCVLDAIQRASGSISNILGTSLYLTGYDGNTSVKRLQVITNNLFKYPEQFENAAWTVKAAISSIVPNAAVAPDGALTADKLVLSGVADPQIGQTYQTGVTLVGQTVTISVWLWTDAGQPTTGLQLYLHDSTATMVGSTIFNITTTPTRYSLTYTFPAGSTGTAFAARIDPPQNPAAGNYVYAWGAMLNMGVLLPYVSSVDREVVSVFDAGSGSFGVVLNDVTGLAIGQAYRLQDTDVLAERDVVVPATSGDYSSVTVATPFLIAPPIYTQFMFGESAKIKKPFRVRAVSGSGDYSRQIVAIEYNASVYNPDATTIVPTPNYSALNLGVGNVTISGVTESLYALGNNFGVRATVHYDSADETYKQGRVFVSRNAGPFVEVGLGADSKTINTADGEVLIFKIVAIDVLGVQQAFSNAPTFNYTVIGKAAPPRNVTNFTAIASAEIVTLSWTGITDLDLKEYEIRLGSTWAASVLVGRVTANTSVVLPAAGVSLQYLIRAIDTSGHYSVDAVISTLAVTLPSTPTLSSSIIEAELLLSWSASVGSFAVKSYEIREGAVYSSATVVAVVNATSFKLPITFIGTKTYHVKAIDIAGNTSVVSSTLLASSPPSATVISNVIAGDTVVISWTKPNSTLPIDGYEVRVGATYATATVIKRTASLSLGYLTTPGDWLGDKTFWVTAYDVKNNFGTPVSRVINIAAPSAVVPSAAFEGEQVRVSWTQPSSALNIVGYTIKHGASFAAGTLISDITGTSITFKGQWVGARNIYVAACDSAGNYGIAGLVAVTITAPAIPTVTWTNVGVAGKLSWTVPTASLPILEYEVRHGASFAAGISIGKVSANSLNVNVNWIGARTFHVAAIDSAGNVGAAGAKVVTFVVPVAPTGSVSIVGDSASIAWSLAAVTTDIPIDRYEVRHGGTSWATATLIGSFYTTSYIEPVSYLGNRTYRVAAIDMNGNVGAASAFTTNINVSTAVVITPTIVDNNVLLKWTDATGSLPIAQYRVLKGAVYATAAIIGKISGNFTAIFESQGGLYKYWVVGIDTAGNIGAEAQVSANVSQPPDYVLSADVDSVFAGTKNNAILEFGKIIMPVNLTEQYSQHFTNYTRNTPQEQIAAGSPVFIEPVPATGSYVEFIDYGATLISTVISVTPVYTNVAGSPNIKCKIETSPDNTTWTVYNDTFTALASNLRYVRVTISSTSVSGNDILSLSALNIKLSAKLRDDAGSGTALATDAAGTQVNFNLAYVDVQSLSVTPKGTTLVVAVYDFVDTPYPTGFKVYLFDKNGNRLSGDYSWTSKGY